MKKKKKGRPGRQAAMTETFWATVPLKLDLDTFAMMLAGPALEMGPKAAQRLTDERTDDQTDDRMAAARLKWLKSRGDMMAFRAFENYGLALHRKADPYFPGTKTDKRALELQRARVIRLLQKSPGAVKLALMKYIHRDPALHDPSLREMLLDKKAADSITEILDLMQEHGSRVLPKSGAE